MSYKKNLTSGQSCSITVARPVFFTGESISQYTEKECMYAKGKWLGKIAIALLVTLSLLTFSCAKEAPAGSSCTCGSSPRNDRFRRLYSPVYRHDNAFKTDYSAHVL